MNYYDHHRLACIQILESFGIRPKDVAIFGASDLGYLKFIRDDHDRIVVAPGHDEPNVEFVEWPHGFPYGRFLEHYTEMVRAE